VLLSVVLVVRSHQAWIRPCLRSLLDQAPADLDVIVIDDASRDHGARVVADVARDDSRVRLLSSDTRRGTAASREMGLEIARGDYVWFLDAADFLLPDALRMVSSALGAGPDVLLVAETERDIFGVQRHQVAPGRRPAMRDRIVRREHILGVDRPAGDDVSDVPLALAVLGRGARVALLEPAVFVHRLLPTRVTEAWSDSDPWAVFAAFDRAFAELADAGGSAGARAELLTDMISAQQRLLTGVPKSRRVEYFHQMSRSLHAHGDDAPQPADASSRLVRRAIATDNYRLYRAVLRSHVPVRRTVRRVARTVPRTRSGLKTGAAGVAYAALRKGPLDPHLAVFSAYWGAAYSCNPRAIYEKARDLAPWLHGVWVVKPGSEAALPAGVEYVVEGSRPYYRAMARATYFVNNVNFPNDIVKRPGQVHLQTHHGTPLKTMGLDLVNARNRGMGLNLRRLMKRVQRWDYSISANEFTTEIWERVYPSGTYESLETGYPRNDVLATATPEHKDRVRAGLGIQAEQKVVLYTPTHRESEREYVPLLDVDDVAERLGSDYVVLVRAHYFYRDAAVASGDSNRVVDVAAHPSIEDLAIASDLLITDYSSLMFDYAVLDRPIVIYAPDWETYSRERGTYFDLMAEPPGAVATTQDDLVEVLLSGSAEDADSATLRRAFRQKFCALEDGRAAERVVQRLWPAPADGH
jgi:CDP-glycerol glycerophosphotransferase